MNCLSYQTNQMNTNTMMELLAIKKLKESVSKTRHIIVDYSNIPQDIIINDDLMKWCSPPLLKSESLSHKHIVPPFS